MINDKVIRERRERAVRFVVDTDMRRMRAGIEPLPEEPRHFLWLSLYWLNLSYLQRGKARFDSLTRCTEQLDKLDAYMASLGTEATR